MTRDPANKDEDLRASAAAESARQRRFGATLRAFRDSYPERVSGEHSSPLAPRMRLSALALVHCLERAGYPISSGAYAEIEAGHNLPRDTRAFLEAVSACLSLNEDQRQQLIYDLGYDLVVPRLGHLARNILRRSSSPLAQQMRALRQAAGLSQAELASCLFAHGFRPLRPNGQSGTREDVAVALDLIEQGSPWPFTEDARRPFLEICARCLSFDLKSDTAKSLAVAMADDVLKLVMPEVDPGYTGIPPKEHTEK